MTLYCMDCDEVYNSDRWIETSIPDEVWEYITPDTPEKGGILCISCIARRLRYYGYGGSSVPIKICGTEPLYSIKDD